MSVPHRVDYGLHAEAMLETFFNQPEIMQFFGELPLEVFARHFGAGLTHRVAVLMDDAVRGACDAVTPPRTDW